MNFNYKSKYFIYIIVMLIALTFFIMHKYYQQTPIRDGEGYDKTVTYINLRHIALTFHLVLTEVEGKNVGALPNDIKTFNSWMDAHYKHWRTMTGDSCFDPNTGKLIDYWRTPIELQVKSTNEYILISPGRNRIYENGKGDDLVYKFNPYEDPTKANKN